MILEHPDIDRAELARVLREGWGVRMDLDVVLPRFASAMTANASLALVYQAEAPAPWSDRARGPHAVLHELGPPLDEDLSALLTPYATAGEIELHVTYRCVAGRLV